MNLSTAIRKGAEQHPQCFLSLINYRLDEMLSKFVIRETCALGAAIVGTYGSDLKEVDALQLSMGKSHPLVEMYPILDVSTNCPQRECAFKENDTTVRYLITHLNDYHHWTREKIADWIEALEQ